MCTTYAHTGQAALAGTSTSLGLPLLDIRLSGGDSDRLYVAMPRDQVLPRLYKRDTSRHSYVCTCEFCGHNGTGEFAMREILEGTDGEITEERYARFLLLVTERGKIA
jgi:hypothetical protein